MNYEGVLIGICSIFIIGAFHPIVIQCEYHFSQRIWPLFLVTGLLLLVASLCMQGIVSSITALVGTACLWSIHELKEQTKRVEKGWFPKKNQTRINETDHIRKRSAI